MASNDWFTQSTSGASSGSHAYGSPTASLVTPQRRSLRNSAFGAQNYDDELDPEDARLAAGITYLPSFGSTPQGRAAMAQSPGGAHAGLSSSTGPGHPAGSPAASYAQPRRSSPTQRFAPGGLFGASDRTSPRASPRGRSSQPVLHQSNDDDAPPTATLDDSMDVSSVAETRLMSQAPSITSPVLHTSSPAPTTASLHVFGPPPHLLPELRNYLSQCGTLVSLVPGPEGSNWITVTYSAEWEAALLLRRNGDIVGGKWLLGVKLAGPGSLAGCSLDSATAQRGSSSTSTTQTASPATFTSGVGTPVRLLGVDTASIYKPRAHVISGAGNSADAADYDWDERPGTNASGDRLGNGGFFGRVGELVFGR